MKHFLLLVFVFMLFPISMAHASLIEHALSLRVDVKMNHIEYEWSYGNPDNYRYIKGDHIVKGQAAKAKVEHLFRILNLSEKTDVNDMVTNLQKNGYNDIQTLEIRYINQEDELYTWVWRRHK